MTIAITVIKELWIYHRVLKPPSKNSRHTELARNMNLRLGSEGAVEGVTSFQRIETSLFHHNVHVLH